MEKRYVIVEVQELFPEQRMYRLSILSRSLGWVAGGRIEGWRRIASVHTNIALPYRR